MTYAEKYLENLQGLLLFMHIKRGYIPSLYEFSQLNSIIRNDLEREFLTHFDEILAEHKKREQYSFDELYQLQKIYSANRGSFVTVDDKYIDEEKAYIELLQKTATPTAFQDKQTYEIIRQLSECILNAARSLNILIPSTIIWGSLHTERFNACAIYLSESSEHLIVFESQLFFFLNRMSKVIAQCIVFKNSDNDNNFQFSVLQEEIKLQIRNNPSIQLQFNKLMKSFIFDGNVKATPNIHIPYPNQEIQHILLNAMELFIMGHEYAHVLKNHFQHSREKFLQVDGINGEEIKPEWENEFEADSLGAFLSIAAMNQKGFQEDFYLVGPDLYFILSDIISQAYSMKYKDNISSTQTHPPALDRKENVRKTLRLSFDSEQIATACFLPDRLSEALYLLWENCKDDFKNIN